MPRTRSQVNRAVDGTSALNGDVSDESEHDCHFEAIETCLNKAGESAKHLQKQLHDLRRENERLKAELLTQQVLNSSDGEPRQVRSRKDANRINDLETKVRELKALTRRNQRRIDKLQSKEVKEEVNELEQVAEDTTQGDPAYQMRKLLRRFHDLMLIVTLGDDEECNVCWERLDLNKSSSMPCEHLICNTCLPNMSRGSDETVECPMCRRRCDRNEVMLVHMSETSRWDALLQVAQAFSAIDSRGEMDTEEEEGEEDFIDCRSDTETASERKGRMRENSELPSLGEASDSEGSPSELKQRRSFSASPMKDKRRRLEKLAEERQSKRSRI
ncbi:hypothetical protein APHAL10511_001703 [Amanita phalloides]|nr:hypothetical protein APHAL10511_001703 [Amanita phalloides]